MITVHTYAFLLIVKDAKPVYAGNGVHANSSNNGVSSLDGRILERKVADNLEANHSNGLTATNGNNGNQHGGTTPNIPVIFILGI